MYPYYTRQCQCQCQCVRSVQSDSIISVQRPEPRSVSILHTSMSMSMSMCEECTVRQYHISTKTGTLSFRSQGGGGVKPQAKRISGRTHYLFGQPRACPPPGACPLSASSAPSPGNPISMYVVPNPRSLPLHGMSFSSYRHPPRFSRCHLVSVVATPFPSRGSRHISDRAQQLELGAIEWGVHKEWVRE